VPASIPQGSELKERLRSLDPKERWRLASTARRGQAESDPRKAAIVVGLARQQLKIQIVIVTGLVLWFIGLPLWRWINDPTSEHRAQVMGALIGLVIVGIPITWFFTRRYKRAERLNLEIVEKSGSMKAKKKKKR
jgi:hypothetical protein